MELKEAIHNRRSIRSFTKEDVPLDDIKEMIRLAGLAPSVNNYQPWKFFAIKNKGLLQQMATAVSETIANIPTNQSKIADNVKSQVEFYSTFFEDAPLVIALAMESYESVLEKGTTLSHDEINTQRNLPDLQSAGASIQNILLAAVDLGYGACWLSAPMMAKEQLQQILNIQDPYHLIAFVAVGKAAVLPRKSNKKELDEIFELIE